MPYRTNLYRLKLERQAKMGETISWDRIAKEIGIAYSTVQRYAHEAVPNPDYSVIDRLAQYFDVPISDLIYFVEDDEIPQEVARVMG